MYYVYLIRSLNYPDQIYIGYTENFEERLECHNAGGSLHTNKYRPWELIIYVAFKNKLCALDYELYLKSGSGRALAAKRFLAYE